MMVTVRTFQWSDLEAVCEMLNAASIADDDPWRVTPEELRHEIDEPGFEPEENCFVAVDSQGNIVGFVDCYLNLDGDHSDSWGAVHPDRRREGIGTQLLRVVERRLLDRLDEVPPGRSSALIRWTVATNVGACALFEREGYRLVRHFHEMRMTLEKPISVPPLPDALTLRAYAPDQDSHLVWQAENEIFRDHWESVTRSFEEWRHCRLEPPLADPALWRVVVDRNEIVGMCICRKGGESDPELGWVSVLGVRRPWRKRGVGTALLLAGLRALQEHGFMGAGLKVDSDSPTGAVTLYERAGMRLERRLAVYQKILCDPTVSQ